MREALREAEAAGEAGQLPIGAVLALDGEIVSRGRNRYVERRTRRHIHAYEGGILEQESLVLIARYDPGLLAHIQG